MEHTQDVGKDSVKAALEEVTGCVTELIPNYHFLACLEIHCAH